MPTPAQRSCGRSPPPKSDINHVEQSMCRRCPHAQRCGSHKYLVVAREDVSGWPEARAIRKANSQTVAKFLEEDIFSRHGCPTSIIVDGGAENKGMVEKLCAQLRVAKHTMTAYHPQANGLVERGHK